MAAIARWLKRRSPGNLLSTTVSDEITGFVYVADGETGPMTKAAAGLQIGSFKDTPPWIVVDDEPGSATLAKWPGRLWKVRVLQKATQQPAACANYTRATAVHVVEELRLASLFGHNGDAIVDFLSSIARLTAQTAANLGDASDADAARVHNNVWDRWLSSVDPGSPCMGEDHSGVIAFSAHKPRSPVGHATSVLYAELSQRARAIAGDSAWVVDGDDVNFNPQWARAAACLQHALFAIGAAQHLASASERVALLRAYQRATP